MSAASQSPPRLNPVLIRASAGTGKTYELSSRYLTLLLAGEEPSRILATTFTRKAAAEIRDRVFLRLAEGLLDDDAREELGRATNLPMLSKHTISVSLRKLAMESHRLSICTLDSLFSRIATCFSLELGLPPGWRISDEVQDREVVRQSIAAIWMSGETRPLAQLIRLLGGGSAQRAVTEGIRKVIPPLFEIYRVTTQEVWGWIVPPERLSNSRLEAAFHDLQEVPLPKTKKGEVPRLWQQAFSSVCGAIEHDHWEGFAANTLVAKIVEGMPEYARFEIPHELKVALEPFLSHARAVFLERHARQLTAAQELLKLYASAYTAARRQSRTLGFGDVKYMLAQAAVTGELDQLYYRLDSRLAHLLLDEFQDTSFAEWSVIFPIADEVLSKGQGEHSFFCVGDVKQAIYGWRGGIAEIFDTIETRWPQVRAEHRECSRRCSPAVLGFVNRVFGSLESNAALRTFPSSVQLWKQRFEAHTAYYQSRPGEVRCDYVDGAAPHDVLAAAAQRVVDVARRSSHARIGVLVRRNDTVRAMRQALQEIASDLATSEEGGIPLTDSSAVQVFLSFLRMVEHPGDTVARFHVANSKLGPLVGLSDWRALEGASALSSRMRARLFKEGLGAVIDDLAGRLLPECDAFDAHRLCQLVEIAYQYADKARIRIGDFVEFIEAKRVEDPSAARIRVMTIHQAKGLEFDAVVIPELHVPLVQYGATGVMCGYEDPVAPPVKIAFSSNKHVRNFSSDLSELHLESSERQVNEALSVLYVALTRAKYALYVLLSKPRVSPAFSSIVAEACGGFDSSRACLFESIEGDWCEHLERQESAQKKPQQEQAPLDSLSLPQSQTFRLVPHLVPSKLSNEPTAAIGSLFRSANSDARRRGIALHRCFEQVDWIDDSVPSKEHLIGRLTSSGMGHGPADEAVQEFLTMLQQNVLQRCLSRERYQPHGCEYLRVYQEYPFVVRDGLAVLSGSIDRIVVGYRGPQPVFAEVFDFKTLPSDRSFAVEAKQYTPQLRAYVRAVSKVFKLEKGDISAQLVFASSGGSEAIELEA